MVDKQTAGDGVAVRIASAKEDGNKVPDLPAQRVREVEGGEGKNRGA